MKTLLFALLFVSVAAHAETPSPEKLAADSDKALNDLAVRVLRPTGGSNDPDTLYGHCECGMSAKAGLQRHGKGFAAGLEYEHFVGAYGTSIPLFLGLTSVQQRGTPRIDGSVVTTTLEAGPMVGVRQRLLRAGVGDATGRRGVFVEPYVGAGFSPFADVSAQARQPDGSTKSFFGTRNPDEVIVPGYVEGGVDVKVGRGVAVGVQARSIEAPGGPGGVVVLGSLTVTDTSH